jgi:hypothetical protein
VLTLAEIKSLPRRPQINPCNCGNKKLEIHHHQFSSKERLTEIRCPNCWDFRCGFTDEDAIANWNEQFPLSVKESTDG